METLSFSLDDQPDSPIVLVEVNEGTENLERIGLGANMLTRATLTLSQALGTLPDVARSVRDQIRTLESPPDEVTIAMGLKFTGETSVKIVAGKSDAHLNVTMKWTNGNA